MTSRYRTIGRRCCGPVEIRPENVPRYEPKCCPPPENRDPRRFERYCAPVVSRSEPLSHAEYLRKKLEAGGNGISGPAGLVQVGEGKYKQTIWTESASTVPCCQGQDAVLPAVPQVHPLGHRLPERERTEAHGAIAGRSTLSPYDQGLREDSLTTLRQKGNTLVFDQCDGCATLEGTSRAIIPGSGCDCP